MTPCRRLLAWVTAVALCSVAFSSTCQNGPSDTTCSSQEYCDGTSACCYLTGICKNSQQANCELGDADDPRFPPASGPDIINNPSNNPDGCECIGPDPEYPNPSLNCDSLSSATVSQGCWGTLRCNGVGTCKDNGYCTSGSSGAYIGGICIQNGAAGTFKYCGDASFSPRPITSSPSKAPTKAPSTKSPTLSPSTHPTRLPTKAPTTRPTRTPTAPVTRTPTEAGGTSTPTVFITLEPTPEPTTGNPTPSPTPLATASPTPGPSAFAPTFAPTPFNNWNRSKACGNVAITSGADDGGGGGVGGGGGGGGKHPKKFNVTMKSHGRNGYWKKGQRVRYTQRLTLKSDTALPDAYWAFYLPDHAAFGSIKTKPKTIGYKQLARQERARARAVAKGKNVTEKSPRDNGTVATKKSLRGSQYLQQEDTLWWNLGTLVPGVKYTISFKIKLVSLPPPGTEAIEVVSIFQFLDPEPSPFDRDALYPVIQCRKTTDNIAG